MLLLSESQKLILSVDLEDFRAHMCRKYHLPVRYAAQEVRIGLTRVLDTLTSFFPSSRVTFFCTGEFAREEPTALRELVTLGHEIACHGDLHEAVSLLNAKLFSQVLARAKSSLEDAIGGEVIGFRAPSFSMPEGVLWPAEVLVENGFRYDSSFLLPSRSDHQYVSVTKIHTKDGILVEFPLVKFSSVIVPPIRALGGTYFRLLPRYFIRRILHSVASRNIVPHVWLHASDFYANYFPISWRETFGCSVYAPFVWPFEQLEFRWGTKSMRRKLEFLSKEYALLGPLKDLMSQALGDETTLSST